MITSTLINNMTAEQIIAQFESLQHQLTELKEKLEPKTPTEYLTRGEVAEMFKCDISTVHNWTKEGKLIPYGIGNRVYYKRHEIEASLIPFGKRRAK